MTGTGQCTNAFFGSDPAAGTTKECDTITTVAAPAPAPAPAPDPAPAPAPAPVVGSATLAWAAPQTNADGTSLADLAGFRILYGTAPGSYSQTITVNSPSTLTYAVSNLSAGTYYFVVKAFDTSNNESTASTEVTKTVK